MAAFTTQAAMDDVFATWINKRFISDLTFALQHQKFTAKAEVPEGFGANIARFIDFAPPGRTGYATGSTAITEGATTANEITAITTTPTNITLAEFGEYIKVGTFYEAASVSGTREKIAKRVRDGAAVSIDTFVRTQSIGSTNVLFATLAQTGGTATAPATVGNAGVALLINAKKVLFDGLATGFDDVAGHPSGDFAAVITSKQELDIVTEVTTGRIYWSNAVVNVPGAMGQEKFVKGYIGGVYGTSVYVTQNYATTTLTSACDIGYVYGDGGVAAASFGAMAPSVVLNDVNSPYKNVNSIAWHAMFGAALVSSTRVVKFYSLS